MKEKELKELKRKYNLERGNFEELKELLSKTEVKRFIKLSGVVVPNLNKANFDQRIIQLFSSFSTEETNGIYVWTDTYAIRKFVHYDYDEYGYGVVDFDDKRAEKRTYRDIESSHVVTAYTKSDYFPLKRQRELLASGIKEEMFLGRLDGTSNNLLTIEFEKDHIVLNPYNSGKNMNGFYEVRNEFLKRAVEFGQEEAKRLVLKKYKRL